MDYTLNVGGPGVCDDTGAVRRPSQDQLNAGSVSVSAAASNAANDAAIEANQEAALTAQAAALEPALVALGFEKSS